MRTSRWLLISALGSLFGTVLLTAAPGCSGDSNNNGKPQCSDGNDNDGDGDVDFPNDLGCVGTDDMSEDSPTSPQCSDGRDNDGDGKHDYPNDPGCFAPNQDDETDDCPDGPGCPQCSDGKDNDMNGQTDFPNDSGGCESASDTDEYTENPVACGAGIMIKKLPFDGHVTGTLDAAQTSHLNSPMCGGAGTEDVYELRISAPKVVVASSDNDLTAADTVLYIRSSDCQNPSSELVCNDDVSTTDSKSSVTKAISTPGTYYLVVDSHDNASAGAYDVTVKFFVGEGIECQANDDCGPGLICRVPMGGTTKVCSKHVCEDGVDDDVPADGKKDYPDDPGCTSPTDDDETDGCPGAGPNCPECGDGIDNDGDTKIDFGTTGDPTCASASSASEACLSSEGVTIITAAATADTTVGATDDTKPACGSSSATAPDKTYRLDLPAMADLTVDADNMSFDGVVALYDATCAGTALQCKDTPETVTLTNLNAGTYYFVVDGYSTGNGTYTINTSGHIKNLASCENALAQAGVITCAQGYACKGTVGSRTCQPALCSDGLDNDNDGKIDFPFDPGCTDPADDTEANPATLPVCSDTTDNDADGATDFPADFGCNGAGGASEVFCTGEMDAPTLITQKTTTTQTTTGKSNDWVPTCQSNSTAPDVAFALQLPVGVQTLSVDTIGSAFDTVLTMRDAQCGTVLKCDDDGASASLRSLITMSNVLPGAYAFIVDGYNTNNGAVTLNVTGTVAPNTPCSSPLFSGGASAVLLCPTGTTCTGSPAKCQ